jgi:formylglycine-generating enzyme required for sulfatase activity
MLGNIREWCLDYVGPYPQNAVVDPVGQATGAKRIHRGGGYPDAAYICRAGNRGNTAPTTSEVQHGFRLAMDILPESAEKEDNEEVE